MGKFVFGLILAVGAMWWAIQGQPIEEVWDQIKSANWWLLLSVGVIFTLQQVLRSHRQMRIVQSTHPEHSFMSSFYILCISFFFINILPLRMGEVMRPILLNNREGMPIGSGFAVVFVERIIDLISAMFMAVLVLALADIPILEGSWVNDIRTKAIWFLPFLLMGLMLPIWLSQQVQQWLTHPIVPVKLQSIMTPFFHQLAQLQKTGQLIWVVLETTVIWIISATMYGLAALAFEITTINFIEGMGILAFTMIGMAAPSAPGFAGTYEASFVGGLVFFGSDNPSANFATALCFHWWIFIVQSASAIIWMVVDGTSFGSLWTQLKNRSKTDVR